MPFSLCRPFTQKMVLFPFLAGIPGKTPTELFPRHPHQIAGLWDAVLRLPAIAQTSASVSTCDPQPTWLVVRCLSSAPAGRLPSSPLRPATARDVYCAVCRDQGGYGLTPAAPGAAPAAAVLIWKTAPGSSLVSAWTVAVMPSAARAPRTTPQGK